MTNLPLVPLITAAAATTLPLARARAQTPALRSAC